MCFYESDRLKWTFDHGSIVVINAMASILGDIHDGNTPGR